VKHWYIKLVLFFLFLIILFALISYLKPVLNKKTCKNITKQEAIELTTNYPEVKEWLIKMEDLDQETIVKYDSINDKNHIMQVTEVHSDHYATYNWYKIDICTGEITSEFSK